MAPERIQVDISGGRSRPREKGESLRIVFLTPDSNLYGSTRSLLNLIDGLRPYGVEAFVIFPIRGGLERELTVRDVDHKVVPFASWMVRKQWQLRAKAPLRLVRNLTLLPSLVRLIKGWDADIIYTNSSVLPAGAFLAAASGRPHVWHVREFGWLDHHLKYDFGRGWFAYWLDRSSAVLSVSHAVENEVLGGLHAPKYVVYNGVVSRSVCETMREEAVSRPASPAFVFAIAGQIYEGKGQVTAIRALAHVKETYPDAKLLVAGTGKEDYLASLRKLCEELGVSDRIEFSGFVADPFDVYRKADACLMCSRCEAMGRVTVEAMAAAKPVIGRNSGGTPELIEHGKTGLLYDGDYTELAARMSTLMDDRDLAVRMGLAGWERAYREFTIEPYAGRLHDILWSLPALERG